MVKRRFSRFWTCFQDPNSYLEKFKHSSRATLRCLAGCMWPAGRTMPRPALVSQNSNLVDILPRLQTRCSVLWFVQKFFYRTVRLSRSLFLNYYYHLSWNVQKIYGSLFHHSFVFCFTHFCWKSSSRNKAL